ncbi:hypothetical protein J2J97_32210 (plasmid) [Rhizobium bangladeshense]|uniref:hypothetical protein n=1 Tax=Rhizobium bangladeshense TaxID=1138189 RepID=UPI001A98F5E9|nr:hypothetical protein [Rhizobium bangladeshense]QSY98570.1 hypothetical protein J2J97_32210 [Rhizobium bangladeshense]
MATTDEEQRKISFLDGVTPAWAYTAEIYLLALRDGTEKGKAEAEHEIRRMAQVADKAVELKKLIDEWVAERKTFIAGETPKLHEIARRLARAVGEELP